MNEKYSILSNIAYNDVVDTFSQSNTSLALDRSATESIFISSRNLDHEAVDNTSPQSSTLKSSMMSERYSVTSDTANYNFTKFNPQKFVIFEDEEPYFQPIKQSFTGTLVKAFSGGIPLNPSSNSTPIKSSYSGTPIKSSFSDTSIKSNTYMPGISNTVPDALKENYTFDLIDEKVKEGQDILRRLLMSTDDRNSINSTEKVYKGYYLNQSSTSTKFPANSSLNKTEEIISKCNTSDPLNIQVSTGITSTGVLKDPVMKSTALDIYEQKPRNEIMAVSGYNKYQEEKLIKEIENLKIELSNHEISSFREMETLKEDNEKMVARLNEKLTNLNKQKETLEDYINQLKGSLAKKNDKCYELQERLHKKLTLIHQLTTSDDQERAALENELNDIQTRKKILEEQVENMEKSFKNQYNEIKELEKRFQKEKYGHMDMLKKKDEEITFLNEQIETLTAEKVSRELEMRHVLEKQVNEGIQKGKSLLQSEMEEIKLSLDNELNRQTRIQGKHQIEMNHLKANLETFKATNAKLKQDLEACRMENQSLENTNLINMKILKDEMNSETDLLKKKIIEHEIIHKSMALELIEESTKLAVVCGTSTIPRISPPDANIDCNVLSEAMVVFKEHLENFRHYALSLRQEHQHQIWQSGDGSTLSSPGNLQTSSKLLRHLQNRVQQLRKENTLLRENSVCENCQNENGLNSSNVMESHIRKNQNALCKEIVSVEDPLPMSPLILSQFISHVAVLSLEYCDTGVKKPNFPADMVKWDTCFPEYSPVDFTADNVMNETTLTHADIRSNLTFIKFNNIDGQIDRRSHMGIYDVIEGIPRNPIGRTGITGRGLLRRWGPNHAVDPIVTRWLLSDNGNKVNKDGKPMLQFVAIHMKDTGEWAIPGGMLNIGQHISAVLKSEFGEEAMNALEAGNPVFNGIKLKVEKLFESGVVIYRGYVDDPRNTDNAWIETVAVNFHDENNDCVSLIPLNGANDVGNLHWLTIESNINLYGNHVEFIKHCCQLRHAYIPE